MKSPTAVADDCDDIFGPPRTYATGYCPPKNRPSMISAKYRQKEERRKVLKISINKLKKIEDPEASLCRSVLINNTMKRLQKEARDEKMQKQQLHYPRCYDNDNFLNIKNEFIKNDMKHSASFEDPQETFCLAASTLMDSLHSDFVQENEFDKESKKMEVFNSLVETNLNSISCNNVTNSESFNQADRSPSHKRSYDDMEDCDVQDVLSQFYMPPTPRMLTCIDDDEDVNVVDDEPGPKRVKIDELFDSSKSTDVSIPAPQFAENSFGQSLTSSRTCEGFDKKVSDFRVNSLVNNISEMDSRLRYLTSGQNMDTDTNPYSCGHASMFNEMQNNVFHSLIASLET